MAFTQVMGNGNYRKWADWEKGDSVEGVITNRTPDQYGNMSVVLKVEKAAFTNNPPAVGSQLTINSCGAFKAVDEQLTRGTRIKVVFQGIDVMTKGKYKGKNFNKVDVFIDDESLGAKAEEAPVDETAGL